MQFTVAMPSFDQFTPLVGLLIAFVADTFLGCCVAIRMHTFSLWKLGNYADLKPGTFRLLLASLFTFMQQATPGSSPNSGVLMAAAIAAAVSYTPTFIADAKAKLILLFAGTPVVVSPPSSGQSAAPPPATTLPA